MFSSLLLCTLTIHKYYSVIQLTINNSVEPHVEPHITYEQSWVSPLILQLPGTAEGVSSDQSDHSVHGR